MILVVGAGAPKLNGYGTWTDFVIGVGILVASVLLFFYRRIVQDKESIHWTEETPTMPEGERPRRPDSRWGGSPRTAKAAAPAAS